MKFLHACQETTQILPGVDNMTIASYCNKVWQTHHLEKDTVGLVSHKGYLQKDIQSMMAKTWLAFLDSCYLEGKLQYAGKDAGEKKIHILGRLYKVDGFLEEENTHAWELLLEIRPLFFKQDFSASFYPVNFKS